MGAYSPAPVLTPELEARAIEEIVRPTLAGMTSRGCPFTGMLYAGLMLTADGPKLIEYNVRFGDPECQVLMMRLRSEEHTSELQSLMRISYAVFCLQKKTLDVVQSHYHIMTAGSYRAISTTTDHNA